MLGTFVSNFYYINIMFVYYVCKALGGERFVEAPFV